MIDAPVEKKPRRVNAATGLLAIGVLAAIAFTARGLVAKTRRPASQQAMAAAPEVHLAVPPPAARLRYAYIWLKGTPLPSPSLTTHRPEPKVLTSLDLGLALPWRDEKAADLARALRDRLPGDEAEVLFAGSCVCKAHSDCEFDAGPGGDDPSRLRMHVTTRNLDLGRISAHLALDIDIKSNKYDGSNASGLMKIERTLPWGASWRVFTMPMANGGGILLVKVDPEDQA